MHFSENSGSPLHLMYDAHTHLHLDQTSEGELAMHEVFSNLGELALMSIGNGDWDQVQDLTLNIPQVRGLFGVHPWFAHRFAGSQEWIDELKIRLLSTPKSAVGEIGLDRKWRTPDTQKIEFKAQLEVFKAQLSLAADLELPVSIHCVHAQGELYQILNHNSKLPPAIYLHAFGGARGTVEQLSRSKKFGSRIYFGFATCINLRSAKGREAIAAVPDDKLVVESDRSSAVRNSIGSELTEMLTIYAEVKGWSGIEEAAQRTTENAKRLYASADDLVR